MKFPLLLTSLLALALAGCPEPEPSPIVGFGAHGSHAVEVHKLRHPEVALDRVTVYLPEDAPAPVPVVLFAHGYGGRNPLLYEGLLRHVASRGHAVVFSPFRTLSEPHEDKYKQIYQGWLAAVEELGERLDTTRVGFAGHSYGAGAIPALARRGILEEGWGANGAFLFIMAPWYVLGISEEELQDYPDVNMMVQVYEEDLTNDPEMARDLYYHLNIPYDNKDYIRILSDVREDGALRATHLTPNSAAYTGNYGPPDGLDFYGVYRLVDALAEFTFTGDEAARIVALGNGGPEQTFMGEWPDGSPVRELESRSFPERQVGVTYAYPFEDERNPRTN